MRVGKINGAGRTHLTLKTLTVKMDAKKVRTMVKIMKTFPVISCEILIKKSVQYSKISAQIRFGIAKTPSRAQNRN